MSMFQKNKIVSLLIVLLMMGAAAITVHKSIFGINLEKEFEKGDPESAPKDTVTVLPSGEVIIHTAVLSGTVEGFGGEVPLDIHIADGKISEITAPENSETPSFFERASSLFNRWIGKSAEEAATMKVDAVSGATYTSAAIISNMQAGLDYYEGFSARSQSSMPWKIWVALTVTLAACVVPLVVKNKIYHTVQLVANIIVLGFWCGQFLDYSMILKYISSGFMLPMGLVAIVMLVAAFIYPLFGRPQHYCNHICPLGAAQQLMGQICGYKITLSPKMVKGLDWFRKILWALLMLTLWVDCFTDWMDLELFQAFQFRSVSWGIIVAALVFIVLSAVISRPYCRFVCPTGSLFKRAEDIG